MVAMHHSQIRPHFPIRFDQGDNFYTNHWSRKRSEVNQIELPALQSRLDETDGMDQPQDSAQTSLCEEEEGTDETRLLGGEEPDDSESRASNLFISNPAGSMSVDGPFPSTTTASDEVAVASQNISSEEEEHEEAEDGIKRGEKKWREREVVREHLVCRCRRCGKRQLPALKKSLLDLRLFFW